MMPCRFRTKDHMKRDSNELNIFERLLRKRSLQFVPYTCDSANNAKLSKYEKETTFFAFVMRNLQKGGKYEGFRKKEL